MDAERWDVTDINGFPTGRTHYRGDADWTQGDYLIVAATCVVRDDGTILITQRHAAKEFGLPWEFPGGSALEGESSRDAAARELLEETGLTPAFDAFSHVGRHVEDSALVDLYLAHVATTQLRLDPVEIANAAWVSLPDIEMRVKSGQFADPWVERLTTLWEPLQLALLTEEDVR